jgi:O-6-methylguanine DNA methyltransferase
VPYGEVVSYGDLARWAGRPKAVRAVGGACGANRIPVIIPCHRVVAKEGLGGFGGGPKMKKQLLKLEKG